MIMGIPVSLKHEHFKGLEALLAWFIVSMGRLHDL